MLTTDKTVTQSGVWAADAKSIYDLSSDLNGFQIVLAGRSPAIRVNANDWDSYTINNSKILSSDYTFATIATFSADIMVSAYTDNGTIKIVITNKNSNSPQTTTINYIVFRTKT